MNDVSKETIAQVLNTMLDSFDRDIDQQVPNEVRKVIAGCLDDGPEHFSMLVSYPMQGVLESSLRLKYPDLDQDKIYDLASLYLNYQIIQEQLDFIFTKSEGMPFSADKSRWVLDRYREWLLSGGIPSFEGEEPGYWVPKHHGAEFWFRVCGSIQSLILGNPVPYFEHLASIVDLA